MRWMSRPGSTSLEIYTSIFTFAKKLGVLMKTERIEWDYYGSTGKTLFLGWVGSGSMGADIFDPYNER